MKRVYARALATLAALTSVAIIVGLAAGPERGWMALSAGLLALAGYNAWMLARLARWLRQPLPEELPEGKGAWEEVLHSMHRHERDAARGRDALADALARFRRAAEALPDGVTILDSENRIEWCNDTAASHLGLDASADVRQPIGNLLRDPSFLAYISIEDPVAAGPIEVSLRRDATFALQIIPYGEAKKLLLSRDITQAQRVETMRRDFVANVSHELRTPLTVLAGFLETMRELNLDPQRIRDYLGMMQGQASRMHRIIEDLLTLSQLESSPPPPAERVRVVPLLERVRADSVALSGGRHVIALDGRPGVDLIGSESELASAFGNLATNAVRYTPAGGEIRFHWRDSADGASFAVSDTGMGIAPEHLPRLTERFYRVDRNRSRESGGTGLGLSIVRHALMRHDARLEIQSTPGKGTTVTARFPVRRTAPATAPQDQKA